MSATIKSKTLAEKFTTIYKGGKNFIEMSKEWCMSNKWRLLRYEAEAGMATAAFAHVVPRSELGIVMAMASGIAATVALEVLAQKVVKPYLKSKICRL